MNMIPTMMPMMAARGRPLDEAESVSLLLSLGEALKARAVWELARANKRRCIVEIMLGFVYNG